MPLYAILSQNMYETKPMNLVEISVLQTAIRINICDANGCRYGKRFPQLCKGLRDHHKLISEFPVIVEESRIQFSNRTSLL